MVTLIEADVVGLVGNIVGDTVGFVLENNMRGDSCGGSGTVEVRFPSVRYCSLRRLSIIFCQYPSMMRKMRQEGMGEALTSE